MRTAYTPYASHITKLITTGRVRRIGPTKILHSFAIILDIALWRSPLKILGQMTLTPCRQNIHIAVLNANTDSASPSLMTCAGMLLECSWFLHASNMARRCVVLINNGKADRYQRFTVHTMISAPFIQLAGTTARTFRTTEESQDRRGQVNLKKTRG